MEPVKSKSNVKLMIVVGVIVVFTIVGGAVYAIVQSIQSAPKTETVSNSTPKEISKNVTQQTLQQDMTDADATIKRAQQYHTDAKAAIEDSKNRTKVSQ